jgi:hypothetical protein
MSQEVDNEAMDDDSEYNAFFDEFAEGKSANAEKETVEEESQDDEADEVQDEESDDSFDEKSEQPGKDETPEQKYQREIDQWKHKYNSDIGRVNAYQRKIQEQEELLKQLQTQGPVGDNPQDSGMSDKEWEDLKNDYPDIAKGFEGQLNQVRSQSAKELDAIRKQIQPLEQKQQEQYLSSQLNHLENEHPDWRDVVQTAEFGSWLNNQPEEIQAFMQSQDAQRNIYLLNSFKSATQPKAAAATNGLQQKRQKQLQQAQTVANRSTSNKREALSEDDYDASFEYYAKKKDSRR